ncbi:MAG: glutaminyl-peptide cyclotransferase [Actinomycetia bacterium]|nr:glutaminyl-peptide cyclotransferase [Actinomycetes bacterium]MCP4222860.1 glutaminyl-peptide cyclotransferase [Actinomycetes bacterium]MCP5033566.1 glutaminyl-peptide cyclotransferase [Actinomycetes bacterium]
MSLLGPGRRSSWLGAGLILLAIAATTSGCVRFGTDTTERSPATIHVDNSGGADGAPAAVPVPPTSIPPPPAESSDPSTEPGSYRGNLGVQVLAQYPHDETAFTQGLEWWGDQLLESTGLEGESTLRLVDPFTGEVSQLMAIDDTLFAEGTTVVDDRAHVLTWRSQTLLTVDLPTLSPTATEVEVGAYSGEGWGLCHDGTSLVMSNGSDQIVFRNPETFAVERAVNVTLDGQPVSLLNELECISDQVLANVWKTNTIMVIDAATGLVAATVDATSLVPEGYTDAGDDVLNGIAFNPETGTLWLTGKRWPVLYEVELVVP